MWIIFISCFFIEGAFAVPAVPRVLNEMEKEKEKEMSEAEKFNASNPLGVLMFGGAKEENEGEKSCQRDTC